MKYLSTFSFIFLTSLVFLCLVGDAKCQNSSSFRPTIETVKCSGCEADILQFPIVEYPRYVGFGPHKYNGKIGIEVTVDKDGNVESSTAIYGHPYFRSLLEKASFSSKFRPQAGGSDAKRKGILIYRVQSVQSRTSDKTPVLITCSDCLHQAISLPKPDYPKAAAYVNANGQVKVDVLIGRNGNVASAKAISGHPLLRAAAVNASLKAKFPPTLVSGKPVSVRGTIVYNFLPPR